MLNIKEMLDFPGARVRERVEDGQHSRPNIMIFKAARERVAVEPLVARYAEQKRKPLGALDVELHRPRGMDVAGHVQVGVRGLDGCLQRPVHRVPV